MENENIVTLQFKFTRDKALLLMALFFLCWHPKPLNSETLTLTTYYPAPYGGYVSLLTTDKTLLARDGGNVGIGTASPGQKLDVNGNIRASGETIGTMASGYGQFRAIAGSYGAFIRNDGADTYMPLITAANNQYGVWNGLRPVRVNNASGDVFLANSQVIMRHGTGSIDGVCRTVGYTLNGFGSCGANERVMTWYGNGNQTCGMLFLGGDLSNSGNWTQKVCFGGDRSGTMLCCRIGG
jgi:hypothetical protein